ncbi:outer membrane beta-barrel protein [Psychroserpens mesophilus]|uniref:outer membrane beta-barrel protein n=1 Tax=Psychroserpens mesophilus TaxID=325473 RepID=UPI003F4937F9
MNKLLNLLVAFLLLFVTNIFAQRPNYDIKNYIGIYGGITQFDIVTDNFSTEKQNGFIAGLTAIVDIEHKWYDLSYGIQFTQNNLGIEGRSNTTGETKMLNYKVSAAQLAVLLHAKIVRQNLTLDFGPVFQANGFLELNDDTFDDYFINGFDDNELTAKGIRDISKFNVNGAIGVTAGFKHFRIRAQYQYGFTNMLNKLNDLEVEDTKFKGNHSQLNLTALVLF